MTDNSLVSLTDLYATFADMLGYRIADDEAEDSFSFWPILDGSGNAARTDLIATSGAGYFTYRTPQYKAKSTGSTDSPRCNSTTWSTIPKRRSTR